MFQAIVTLLTLSVIGDCFSSLNVLYIGKTRWGSFHFPWFSFFESNQACFCAWNHMKAFSAWKLYQHCMSDMRSRWMKSLIRETETWRNCTGNSTPTFLTRFQEGPWRKRNSDEFVIEDDFWVWLIFVRENLMLMCIICDRCGMWDSHGDVI